MHSKRVLQFLSYLLQCLAPLAFAIRRKSLSMELVGNTIKQLGGIACSFMNGKMHSRNLVWPLVVKLSSYRLSEGINLDQIQGS